MDLLKTRTIILCFSLLFCFGCISLTNNTIKPSASPISSDDPTQSTKPTNSTEPVSSTPSPSVIPVPTSLPTLAVGGDFVLPRTTLAGHIYDTSKNPLSGVNVSLKWLNKQDLKGRGDTEFTTEFTGIYFLRGLLDDLDVEITASKTGYITVIRNVHIDIGTISDVNFGGVGVEAQYALKKIE